VRRRERASELVALVIRRKQRISEDFYDIGAALIELATAPMYRALGFKTFAQLLERLELSPSFARRLMSIARELPRKLAVTLGQEKSMALVQLAAVTPDTAASLANAKLVLPGMAEPIDVAKQSGRAVRRLAAAIRQQRLPEDAGSANAERAARAVQQGFAAAGLAYATSRAVRRRRKGATETFDLQLRVPVDALTAVAHVLAGVAARR
jgi:hypothetical protein